MKKTRLCSLPLAALSILVFVNSAGAQIPSGLTRVYGTSDRDVPTPAHSTKTASDAAALSQVIDFVKVTGATAWKGMTATGTITYGGDTQSYPATLSILDSTQHRLDVEKSAGKESTVFNGNLAYVQSASGKRRYPSSDMAVLGLVAFPKMLAPNYPAANTILTDQGTVSIGGHSLHRITLDDPSTDVTGSAWKTVDLYFDPATKYLVQSVAFVHLSSADAAFYTIETTYDDYQTEGGMTLPHRFTESLNGNLEWTLQLNKVDLSTLPEPSLFSF